MVVRSEKNFSCSYYSSFILYFDTYQSLQATAKGNKISHYTILSALVINIALTFVSYIKPPLFAIRWCVAVICDAPAKSQSNAANAIFSTCNILNL